MASYEYVSCVTGFSEGGDNTLWQPKALPMAVERMTNRYTNRLLEVGLLAGGVACVATGVMRQFLPIEMSQEMPPDRYLTVSRNGAESVTLTFGGLIDPNSVEEQQRRELMLFGQDGSSIAFLEAPFGIVSFDNAEEGAVIADGSLLTGIGSDGSVTYEAKTVDVTQSGLRLFPLGEFQAPHTLRAEENTLTFMPTPNVPREVDDYYLIQGSDTQDSITIHSCAVLELGQQYVPINRF